MGRRKTASGKRRDLEKRMDKEMNDLCPLIYVCRDVVEEWRCFGRYNGCADYVAYCKKYSQTKGI